MVDQYTAYLILDSFDFRRNVIRSNDQTNFNFTVSGPVLVPDLAYSGTPSANPNPVTAGNSVAINLTIANIEIGRASCRERVKISVVAVSLKKKVEGYFVTPAISAN